MKSVRMTNIIRMKKYANEKKCTNQNCTNKKYMNEKK